MPLKLIQGKQINVNLTGSFTGSFSGSFNGTGSYATQALSASYAPGGSSTFPYTGNAVISGSLQVSGSITGSLFGTSSYTTQALSASFATTASYALNAGTTINTGSFVTTSSFNSFTGSYNTGSFTGSFTGSLSGTSSWANNATNAVNVGVTDNPSSGGGPFYIPFVASSTGNTAIQVDSSTFLYAPLTNTITVANLAGTASWATQALTASFITTAQTASFVTASNVFGPFGSNSILSASYAVSSSRAVTSSFALTSSYVNPLVQNVTITGSAQITGSLGVTGSLNVSGSITGSLFGTSSWAQNATTAPLYLLLTGGSLTGNLTGAGRTFTFQDLVLGSGTTFGTIKTDGTKYIGIYPTNATESTRFLANGNVMHGTTFTDLGYRLQVSASGAVSGALQVIGTSVITGSLNVSAGITGSLFGTSSWAVTSSVAATSAILDNPAFNNNYYPTFTQGAGNSNLQIDTSTFTYNPSTNLLTTTASYANQAISASNSLTASYVNPLRQDVLITGSLNISGSEILTGYMQFMPVSTNINNSISASYMYVSGSTNDLYFTQNGSGYGNTTRLRWIEGNLYTGLLSGGVISSTPGSTTFNVSSGSGIIVTLNASTASTDPYPIIQYVKWPTYTAQPIENSGSAKITYLSITSAGTVAQQTVPIGSTDVTQWDTQIELGVVLHLSGSVSTGVYNSPQVGYGFAQRTDDFVRAFGPMKLSGHTLQASGSSPTLSLIKGSGTAYNNGANYTINPNHPSTVTDPAVNVSKIYRYYISGSTPVIDTGVANAGYTAIDSKNYVDTTTGTLALVGGAYWSIQRVFWIPNSPTNAFIVYYGNDRYRSLVDATNAKDSEPFIEAPNTAQNAIFLGYVIIQGGGSGTPARDLLNASEATIIPGGLFRSVGGVGSSGTTPIATTFSSLSDVSVASRAANDLLTYNGSQWVNTKSLTGNYSINGNLTVTGSLIGTASLASTASYYNETDPVFVAKSGSLATTGSNTFKGNQIISGSVYLRSGSVIDSIGADIAIKAGVGNNAGVVLYNNDSSQYLAVDSTGSYTNKFTVGGLLTVQNTITTPPGQYFVASSDTSTEMSWSIPYAPSIAVYSGIGSSATGTSIANTSTDSNGDALPTKTWSFNMDGTLTAPGRITASSFTGSLFGTASYTTQALSSSYALTASYALNGGGTTINTSSLATTGSNTFRGNQTITGSLNISGSTILSGSLNVSGGITGSLFGTASYATTASYVNPLTQTVQITGSLNVTGSITSSGTIAPNINSTYNIGGGGSLRFANGFFSSTVYASTIRGTQLAFGDEVGGNYLKIFPSPGNIAMSNATSPVDDGVNRLQVSGSVKISNNLTVTGSATINGGITGSLFGTASYAVTASYALNGGGGSSGPSLGLVQAFSLGLQNIF